MGRREDERIRYADWAAEQAASAMLDSAWDYAIIWSDRAVDGTRSIYRKNRTDERVVDIFAGRLWDRALIHQAQGNVSEGIRDATEALTLFEELAAAHGTQYELRIPSVRLLLCELYAVAGDPEAARRYGQAIEAYRERLVEPSLLIADAFARYGTAMRAIGDPAAAPAFRQAVDVYRMPEVDVTDKGVVRRFVQTAVQVATDAEPATATAALEILPVLQDAAERTVRLVPEVYPFFATPENNADMRTTLAILDLESAWLLALGAPRTAAYYADLAKALAHNVAWGWSDAVAAAGRLLDETLRRGGDPPEVP
ncbi:hypothetical protein [Actinopolymorpha pittospori]